MGATNSRTEGDPKTDKECSKRKVFTAGFDVMGTEANVQVGYKSHTLKRYASPAAADKAMTTYTGFQRDPPAPLFLALDQTGCQQGETLPPKVDYVEMYFKVNRHGFYQPLYDHDSDDVYSKLPVGVRPLAVSFRPRTDLVDFSVFTPVTYSLEYGPKKGGHSPAMDGFTRVQLSKGGLYPAVNPKPFPESPGVGLWLLQDAYLKPKAYNPRVELRLYYTSDESIFPDPKEMKVTVTGALLITPTGKTALDGSTPTQITLAQVLSVLSGTPPGVKIKTSSLASGMNLSPPQRLFILSYLLF